MYGENGARIDDFLGDRFPFRGRLLSLKQSIDRLFTGESNNILFTSDGYLVDQCHDNVAAQTLLHRNLEALDELMGHFSTHGIPSSFYLAPRTIDVVTTSLPKAFTDTHSIASSLTEAKLVDLSPLLRDLHSAGISVMYKTDHHWTTLGAYHAYTAICPALGITPYPMDDFERIKIKSNFIGTTQAHSGCLVSEIKAPDTIELFRYQGDDCFTVTIHDTKETRKGLYCEKYLFTKDAYRVFLGGNFGRVSIKFEESAVPLRPRLLLVKDSFALSLLPFLLRHYDIDLIDPRYDTEASLSALLAENAFDCALILLGKDTIASSATIHRWCRRAVK